MKNWRRSIAANALDCQIGYIGVVVASNTVDVEVGVRFPYVPLKMLQNKGYLNSNLV